MNSLDFPLNNGLPYLYPSFNSSEPPLAVQGLKTIQAIRQEMLERGFINPFNELQEGKVILPEPADARLEKTPEFQEFLNKKISYRFVVDEKILQETERTLLKGIKQNSAEFNNIHLFLKSAKEKVFAKELSFYQILLAFKTFCAKENKDSPDNCGEAELIELLGGWVLYVISQNHDGFDCLFKKLLEENGVCTGNEKNLLLRKSRYRPEMDLKMYFSQKQIADLFIANDQFFHSFIRLFEIDPQHDIYYYRVLFKQFLPKASEGFPNSVLGNAQQKLDVLFVNTPVEKPLFMTDQVTFAITDKVVLDQLSLVPIQKKAFQQLELRYTSLIGLYQCLINLYFGVDHLCDPLKANDKAIPRMISRLTAGFFFPKNEFHNLLESALKNRKLSDLFLDFHQHHHEGNSELFLVFILNAFHQLHHAKREDLVEGLWSDLKSVIVKKDLQHPILKLLFDLLDQNCPYHLLEKTLQFAAFFEKDCEVGSNEFNELNYFKITLNEFGHLHLPKIALIHLFKAIPSLEKRGILTRLFDLSWFLEALPSNKNFLSPFEKESLAILKSLCFASNETLSLKLIQKICRTSPFISVQNFAEKLKDPLLLKKTFVLHFVSEEVAEEAIFELSDKEIKDSFDNLQTSLGTLSIQKGARFLEQCLHKGFLNRSMLGRFFSYYKKGDFESQKVFSDLIENLLLKYLNKVPGKPCFFDAFSEVFEGILQANFETGIELINLAQSHKELSSRVAQKILKNQVLLLSSQPTLEPHSSHLKRLQEEIKTRLEIEHQDWQSHSDSFALLCQTDPSRALQQLMDFWKNGFVIDELLYHFVLHAATNGSEVFLGQTYELIDSFLTTFTPKAKSKWLGLFDKYPSSLEGLVKVDLLQAFSVIEKMLRLKLISRKNAQPCLNVCYEKWLAKADLNENHYTQYLALIQRSQLLQLDFPLEDFLEWLIAFMPKTSDPRLCQEKIIEMAMMGKTPFESEKVAQLFITKINELVQEAQEDALKEFFLRSEKVLSPHLYDLLFSSLAKLYFSKLQYTDVYSLIREVYKKNKTSLLRPVSKTAIIDFFSYAASTENHFLDLIVDQGSFVVFKGREDVLAAQSLVFFKQQIGLSKEFQLFIHLLKKNEVIVDFSALGRFFQERCCTMLERGESLSPDVQHLFQSIVVYLSKNNLHSMLICFLESILVLPLDFQMVSKEFLRSLEIVYLQVEEVKEIQEAIRLLKKVLDCIKINERTQKLYAKLMESLVLHPSLKVNQEVFDQILCFVNLNLENLPVGTFFKENGALIEFIKNLDQDIRVWDKEKFKNNRLYLIENLKEYFAYSKVSKDASQNNSVILPNLNWILYGSSINFKLSIDLFFQYFCNDINLFYYLVKSYAAISQDFNFLIKYQENIHHLLGPENDLDATKAEITRKFVEILIQQTTFDVMWVPFLEQSLRRMSKFYHRAENLKLALYEESALFDQCCLILDKTLLLVLLKNLQLEKFERDSACLLLVKLVRRSIELFRDKKDSPSENLNKMLYQAICQKLVLFFSWCEIQINGDCSEIQSDHLTIFLNKDMHLLGDFIFEGIPYFKTQNNYLQELLAVYCMGPYVKVTETLKLIINCLPTEQLISMNHLIIQICEKDDFVENKFNKIALDLLLTKLLKQKAFLQLRFWLTSIHLMQMFPEVMLKCALEVYRQTHFEDFFLKAQSIYRLFMPKVFYLKEFETYLSDFTKCFNLSQKEGLFYSFMANTIVTGLLWNSLKEFSDNTLSYYTAQGLNSESFSLLIDDAALEAFLDGNTRQFFIENNGLQLPSSNNSNYNNRNFFLCETVQEILGGMIEKCHQYFSKRNFLLVKPAQLLNKIDLTAVEFEEGLAELKATHVSFFDKIKKFDPQFCQTIHRTIGMLLDITTINTAHLNHQLFVLIEMFLEILAKEQSPLLKELVDLVLEKLNSLTDQCSNVHFHRQYIEKSFCSEF